LIIEAALGQRSTAPPEYPMSSTNLAVSANLRMPATVASQLRCPRCRSLLHADADFLACAQATCGLRFPVVRGVPILIDESSGLFDVDAIAASAVAPAAAEQRSSLGRLLPTLSRNYRADENYRLLRQELEKTGGGTVLVVGGGTAAFGIGELKKSPNLEIVETDVFIASQTDAVCDAHRLPFADEAFDAVIIQGVLCYLQDPSAAVAEIHRVLRPDGWVYSETPFVQQVTGGRFDFVRFTGIGHRRIFNRFSERASGPVGGPGMVLAWSWHYFLLTFASTRRTRSLLSAFARLTAFWLPWLDRWLGRRPWAIDAASGVFFLGRKSETVTSDREISSSYRGGLQ
jgi:SAM-dependent methyltransferase